MLRTILFSVLLPTMMTAIQKEPYFYRMPLDSIYARTGLPNTEKLDTHTKKTVIQGSQANKPQNISPNEFTFTAKPTESVNLKPVNIEPVSRNADIEQRKSDNNIPAYILKSMELSDHDVNENEVNMNDIFSNVKPNQIQRIQVPLISKEPDSLPKQFVRPGLLKKQLPDFNKKALNYPTKEYNLPLTYRPPLNGLSLPIENIKPVNKPVNELTLPGEYDNFRFSSLPEKRVFPLPILAHKSFSKNLNKDRLLKSKLVSLLLSSKKDIENQVRDLQSIHDTLKSETMYKIGYLTSHMNKMNKHINMIYRSVQENHHNWDALQILEAYEEVKKNNETVRELLNAMRSYLRAKKRPDQIGSRVEKNPFINSISWAYYDDTMP
ncbi:uncharacterized protein LOC133532498 [Cydia pomonella]|uniref:uncharacterized protein LOC133532498 n=1 Tax=Cydia pomonella TaxID=82600 RepID=UPI002ADD8E75|nr:uncharacterized protein LOC133532498 [Cydia pomonella]